MTRQTPGARRRQPAEPEPRHRGERTAVTTERSLLTGAWTADVDTMEAAIALFTTHRSLENDCQVMLFEIAGDTRLHVNVIHRCARTAVRGWSGPGQLATGSVYNRRFADGPTASIIEHIRNMVFA